MLPRTPGSPVTIWLSCCSRRNPPTEQTPLQNERVANELFCIGTHSSFAFSQLFCGGQCPLINLARRCRETDQQHLLNRAILFQKRFCFSDGDMCRAFHRKSVRPRA